MCYDSFMDVEARHPVATLPGVNPMPYNSTVEAAIIKIEHEARAVLAQHPEGLTNSQVSVCLGLKQRDPKHWFSYNILQSLLKKGVACRPKGGMLYFSVEHRPA